MVRSILAGLVVVAACAPRVDPKSPFDEDDPRAKEALSNQGPATAEASSEPPAAAPAAVAPVPVELPARQGPGVREGVIARADLVAVLDAHPPALLRTFEVTAELERGKFAGWRLVRLLNGGQRFAALDLEPGDVLVSINGRALVTPFDLDALWTELYKADQIVAELRRARAPFTLRFTIAN